MRSIELREDYTITMPKLTDQRKAAVRTLLETDTFFSGVEKKPSLMVVVEATHSGLVTKNMTLYLPEWMSRNYVSWTNPHEKPVLKHHDKTQDPIGRVKQAVYVNTVSNLSEGLGEGPAGHCELLCEITDRDAIEKILDGRLNTVSVGSSSSDVTCSICKKNLAEELCSHQKGKNYEDDSGKTAKCIWYIGKLTYNEVSFVNVPADGIAKVRTVTQSTKEQQFNNSDASVDIRMEDSEASNLRKRIQRLEEMVNPKEDSRVAHTAEDLQFLKNFATAYQGKTPDSGNKETVDMFKFAHDTLHRIYDEVDKVPQEHLDLHTFIHDNVAILGSDFAEGPLDEHLIEDVSEKEPKEKAAPVKTDKVVKEVDASSIKTIVDVFDLTDDEFAAIEDKLPEDLKRELSSAVLSTKSRKALPDAAFCGPNRSFPAHDASHVRNALARLPQSSRFTGAQKSRILGCLRGKAKKLGVKVSSDGLAQPYELWQASIDDIAEMDAFKVHLDSVTEPMKSEIAELKEQLDSKKEDSDTSQKLADALLKIEEMQAQLDEKENELSQIRTTNRDMYKKMHRILAQQVVDKRIELKKIDTKPILTADKEEDRKTARENLIDVYAEKSNEVLKYALEDLDKEISVLPPVTKIQDPGIKREDAILGAGNHKGLKKFVTGSDKTKHVIFGPGKSSKTTKEEA